MRAVVAPADDSALLARLRAGDAVAFEALVGRHHGRLLRLARMFVASDASAEEVVQDTWLAVLNGLDDFEGRASLVTWISRILVNRARTRGVRDARHVSLSTMGDEDDAEPAVPPERFTARGGWASPPARWDSETPERLVGNRQAMALLDDELRRLPERQRLVVMLRDTLGWTADEVCAVLDVNEPNQRVLLHRARARLRARLAAHFEAP